MRLDELPTSDRIEDRRRFPGGRAGLGIGTVVILGLLAWALGIDPRVLIGGAETMSRNGQTQQQTDAGSTGAPSDEMGHFVSGILGSTEVEWKDAFAQAGKTYEPPTLVMFSGATQSACRPPSVTSIRNAFLRSSRAGRPLDGSGGAAGSGASRTG